MKALPDQRYILVATTHDIRLMTLKKDESSSHLILSETELSSLDQGNTSVMVEFEKTGRVFFGSQGGRISELTFQNTENSSSLMTRF